MTYYRAISQQTLEKFLAVFTVSMYYYKEDITQLNGCTVMEILIPCLLPKSTIYVCQDNQPIYAYQAPESIEQYHDQKWPEKLVQVLFKNESITLDDARKNFAEISYNISEETYKYCVRYALSQFLDHNANRFLVIHEKSTYEGQPARHEINRFFAENNSEWPAGITVYMDDEEVSLAYVKNFAYLNQKPILPITEDLPITKSLHRLRL